MTRKKHNKKNTGKSHEVDSQDESLLAAETAALSAEVLLKEDVNIIHEPAPSGI